MFLKSQLELKQELKAAQEDRRILAKQLRDERSLSSALLDIILNERHAEPAPQDIILTEQFPDGTEREVIGAERDYLLEAYNQYCGDW